MSPNRHDRTSEHPSERRAPTHRGRAAVPKLLVIALIAVAGLGVTACAPAASADTLRLGYLPNVTHAPAIVAVEESLVQDALPTGVSLETTTFNAGGPVMQALLSGQLDAAYVGANPAINGWARSNSDGTEEAGGVVKIVSGAASGGSFLVVAPHIHDSDDLTGATISSPGLANTQDVALRSWLADRGYSTDTTGGGDVRVLPQDNAQILATFIDGRVDGAWVPQPWATRLVEEGAGHVLIDERDLWPDGEFVTTQLVVHAEYLERYPENVAALLEANLDAIEYLETNRDDAEVVVADGIESITGRPMPPGWVTASFDTMTFTYDPIASSLRRSADDAIEFDLLDPVDLSGIHSLDLLNALLERRGLAPVHQP